MNSYFICPDFKIKSTLMGSYLDMNISCKTAKMLPATCQRVMQAPASWGHPASPFRQVSTSLLTNKPDGQEGAAQRRRRMHRDQG